MGVCDIGETGRDVMIGDGVFHSTVDDTSSNMPSRPCRTRSDIKSFKP